jgi:hypothetical protein
MAIPAKRDEFTAAFEHTRPVSDISRAKPLGKLAGPPLRDGRIGTVGGLVRSSTWRTRPERHPSRRPIDQPEIDRPVAGD